MKILLVGGGTSGHVLPALSVGRAILKESPQSEVWFVGSRRSADREVVQSAGFKFISIPAGKLRRYWDWQNIIDLFVTLAGWFSAMAIILRFQPNRVFIKGGYVGVPVGFAAWILARPIIIHESDARMGLANRLLTPLAKRICVSFPVDSYKLPKKYIAKLIHTGTPVNEIFYTPEIENNTGIPFSEVKPFLLVMGGSQGAQAINRLVQASLSALIQDYQVLHLAGARDFATLKEWAETERFRHYYLFESLPNEQVAYLMRKAAVIISRAGATAIAEIAASARPVILVPLPSSANQHQLYNAEYLADRGAAVLIKQEDLTPEVLQERIFKIMNSDLGPRLIFNIKSITQKDADLKIAHLVLYDNNDNLN
ncbi:MAG: UDP-N-acetylglucosamine--N-acetylmuramyl-(pentapeptide) pyrophosphoryl-undecaprenol N-acetylglucosamine transferase [Patescibacteria group bacterium]